MVISLLGLGFHLPTKHMFSITIIDYPQHFFIGLKLFIPNFCVIPFLMITCAFLKCYALKFNAMLLNCEPYGQKLNHE